MALLNILGKLFGNKYDKDVKDIMPIVEQINKEFSEFKDLSNDNLRDKTLSLKKQVSEFTSSEKEEVEKLFTPDNIVIGRSKQELNIDSAFEPGGGNGSWCLPFDQQAAFYFSYTSGNSQAFDQDFSQGYLRPVRLYQD